MFNTVTSHCTYGFPAGTKWLPEVREVKEDAVSVARLRSCGMIVIGKAVMHELGMGTTGNNPHHGHVFMIFSLGPAYTLLVLLWITLAELSILFRILLVKREYAPRVLFVV